MFLLPQAPVEIPEPIQIVLDANKEEPEPIPEQPPITWQDNPNNCNEESQWIAAEEPFYCIDRPQPAQEPTPTPRTQQTSSQAVTAPIQTPQATRNLAKPSSGWFPYGQCTYYVWSQRNVGFWNNASDWLWQARRDGYATGSTPRVGAIAWEPGHVSLVVAVNGNQVTVREMNYRGHGVISTRTASATNFTYIY